MGTTETEIKQFRTSGGARVFAIPLQLFPILRGFVYLVVEEGEHHPCLTLIDSGSGMSDSNAGLLAGLRAVGELLGKAVDFAQLDRILITHGHIDHFGGCAQLREQTSAKVYIHELDLRNLTNYEERIVVVSKHLEEFLVEAGASEALRHRCLELYRITKSLGRSITVHGTYEAENFQIGRFQVLHVPGHCAGHVVLKLDNVLFSGDMVLSHITPHQAPERLTHYTGLGHYLESLARLESWARDIEMTFGGHGAPIMDLEKRIQEIREVHQERLAIVLDILKQPHTITEVSQKLFGEVSGYNILLALEESGAHVEYLYQRGLLEIANLQDLENSHRVVPIRYRRV
ncbi:MAG: MBL fold metallo-hydrolase [Anaerolineae bacterium]|jgi:glyoxylase-like metal-dependent hydrolase (beta-lactamase superfamily II)|nr:MAG: MBL fold metallo-hydrolase [Anaerolineae bacterium]